jgi:cardiolipin synthase (CMP-forming)
MGKNVSSHSLSIRDIRLIPNLLCILRILLIAPLLWLFSQTSITEPFHPLNLILVSLYFIMALTDFLDGWFARHLHQESTLGRVLDPIADKLAILGLGVGLVLFRDLPWIYFVFVAGLQLIIILGGILLIKRKYTVTESNQFGKWTTTFLAGGGVSLIFLSFFHVIPLTLFALGWIFFMLTLISYTFNFIQLAFPHLSPTRAVGLTWISGVYILLSGIVIYLLLPMEIRW